MRPRRSRPGSGPGARSRPAAAPRPGLPLTGSALRPTERRRDKHPQLLALVALGGLAAATVGYLVAQNPQARPAHVAVGLRIAIIVTLLLAGAFAQVGAGRRR